MFPAQKLHQRILQISIHKYQLNPLDFGSQQSHKIENNNSQYFHNVNISSLKAPSHTPHQSSLREKASAFLACVQYRLLLCSSGIESYPVLIYKPFLMQQVKDFLLAACSFSVSEYLCVGCSPSCLYGIL